MNIIIGQDKYVRLTQYSNQAAYNLEDIVFYISKTLYQTTVSVVLKLGLNSYPFMLVEEEKQNDFYHIYKVAFSSNVSLKANAYNVEVRIDTDIISIGEINFNQIQHTAAAMFKMGRSNIGAPMELTDTHLPIDIDAKTRKINISSNNNDNTLLSGDSRSQTIRFRLPKRVDDNVDISDESKEICVDYKIENAIKSKVIESSTYELENIDGTDYLIIPWVIENDITQKPGTIEFALSVTDENTGYVWQTLPANLVILKSLGRDFRLPINEPAVDPTYGEVLDFVRNIDYVSEVDTNANTITVVTQENGTQTKATIPMTELLNNENGEVIFSGGGALG